MENISPNVNAAKSHLFAKPRAPPSSPRRPRKFRPVYFHIEATKKTCTGEIIQLAARYRYRAFSTYILPTEGIPWQVSLGTGLVMNEGQMFNTCDNHILSVEAVSKEKAVDAFLAFLSGIGRHLLLVGFEAFQYDAHLLAKLIAECDKVPEFRMYVHGFSETRELLKEQVQKFDSKGSIPMDLNSLAGKFMDEGHAYRDAVINVRWLQYLVTKSSLQLPKVAFLLNYMSTEELLVENAQRLGWRRELAALEKVVRDDGEPTGLCEEQIDRFVEEKLGLENLRWNWRNGGEEFFRTLLTEPTEDEYKNPRPPIAANEDALVRIMDCLRVVFRDEIVALDDNE